MTFEALVLSVIGGIITCVICDTAKYIWREIR